jgi:hypothetical protein
MIHDSRLGYLGFTIGCFGVLSGAYRVYDMCSMIR